MTPEEMQKKLDELEAQLTTETAKVAKLETASKAIANLSDEDREVFKTWNEERQREFLVASNEVQKDMLKASRDVTKSDDLPEEVKKQFDDLSKRLETAETRAVAAEQVAKAEREARELSEFAKQAEKEFAGIPGTPEEKAKILKSLSKLSEEERAEVLKVFSAGNAALMKSMGTIGRETPGPTDAWSKIETTAKALASEKNISQAEAVSKVLDEHPEWYVEYLSSQGK